LGVQQQSVARKPWLLSEDHCPSKFEKLPNFQRVLRNRSFLKVGKSG